MKAVAITGMLLLAQAAQAKPVSCEDVRKYTVDVASSIKGLREDAKIKGSCEAYHRFYNPKTGKLKAAYVGYEDQLTRLMALCGKEMFFYLAMPTASGVPVALMDSLLETFPEHTGKKFEKLGMLTDDSIKDEKWPLGLVDVKHLKPASPKAVLSGKIKQISCAGCHVNFLPTGQLAVGMPNHHFDLGKFNALAIFPFWRMDSDAGKLKNWSPSLTRFYRALEAERLRGKKIKNMISNVHTIGQLGLQNVFFHILGEQIIPKAAQDSLLMGGPGVFNHVIPMMNVNREFYFSMNQIWGLESDAHHPTVYGSLNEVDTLKKFVEQAVLLTTDSHKFSRDMYLDPLTTYIQCLKTPVNPAKRDLNLQAHGKEIFRNNCMSCHDTPNGASLQTFPHEMLGSPTAYKNVMANYVAPDIQSRDVMKIMRKLAIPINVPKGMRARRLNGIWARKKLMHNGAIQDMDHLFCLNGKRRRDYVGPHNPLTDRTHSDLCTDYSEQEKKALMEFLSFL